MSGPLGEGLSYYKQLRDEADARLHRAHWIWFLILLGMLGVVTMIAEGKVSGLTRQLVTVHVALDSAVRKAGTWERRAAVLAESVKVDTERVTTVIQARPQPVLVPMPQANGTTSIVPMVPVVAFDSLGASCTRLEHDCTATVAAKDSAMRALQIALGRADSMTALAVKRAAAQQRASLLSRVWWGLGGLAAGRLSCVK